MKYAAVIHKDSGSDYGVTIPDLPGCFTAGDTENEDAASMAVEAAQLHLEGYLEELIDIPAATNIDKIIADEQDRNGVWVFVEVDVSKLSGKAKRLNITIPKRILAEIDAYVSVTGSNRPANASVSYMAEL